MSKNMIRFAPWVGPHYERGLYGLRILLVCESHYGGKQHERPTVTPEIVKALALGDKYPRATKKLRRHPHFTKIMAAVQNVSHGFSKTERVAFWSSVAYYNFLQELISDSRIPPPAAAWEHGKGAFSEVLTGLAPDLIICFSLRTGKRIRSLANGVLVAVVNHPSPRFAYSRVKPIIAAHIEMALNRKAQTSAFVENESYKQWCEATTSALPTPGSHLTEADKAALLVERGEAMAVLDSARE